ncbi:MAG: hypothetical protein NTV94_19915 [Planctomycetota bacterium]|nr:hypothetical protein [Planctomycetota bacterium]
MDTAVVRNAALAWLMLATAMVANVRASQLPLATASQPDVAVKHLYCWVRLQGSVGTEISETPLREIVNDAKQQGADTIIFEYEPVWEPLNTEPRSGERNYLDELIRAEALAKVLTEEIPRDWVKQPRIAMWVKNACGNGIVLPMACNELYFASTARMGGFEDFGRLGDPWSSDDGLAQKWSLCLARLTRRGGPGGHEPLLLRAMCNRAIVLSLRNRDGGVELFEGLPSSPGEELLTDDGIGPRQDDPEAIRNRTGNDVLTIDASLALRVGLSRKTIDSRGELLEAMGLASNAADASGCGDRVLMEWREGVTSTKLELCRLSEQYQRIAVGEPGDNAARKESRVQKREILLKMIGLFKGRFGESLDARWSRKNQVPSRFDLEILVEQLKLEQSRDRQ